MEDLMYEFLEEFLLWVEDDGFLLSRVGGMKIEKKGKDDDGKEEYRLKCELFGDSGDYEIEGHIKAITYSDMFVKQAHGKWISQVVVDV